MAGWIAKNGRRCAALLAGALLLALTAPAAHAEPGWTSPFEVLQAPFTCVGVPCMGIPMGQESDMNGRGDVAVAYQAGQEIAMRFRAPGGEFGPALPVASPGVNETVYAPAVSIDDNGNTLVVYLRVNYSTNTGRLETAHRPAGGSFATDPTPLATGANIYLFSLSSNDSGDAVVAWERAGAIEARFRSSAGALSSASILAASGGSNPATAIDPAGNSLVLFGRGGKIESSYRPRAGGFAAAAAFSATGASAPSVAMDDAGNAVAVWRRIVSSTSTVQRAFRPAGGGFGSEASISGAGAWSPQAAVDAAGTAVAAWTNDDGTVEASVRPAAGDFGAEQLLGTGGPPFVAMSAGGRAIVTWTFFDTRPTVSASTRAPGGTFTSPATIYRPPTPDSGPARFVSAGSPAMDDEGNGVLLFVDYPMMSSGTQHLLAAGFDAAPPRITGSSIPSAGVVGQALPFSATATDVWSPVTWSWAFGDGTGASGSPTQHAYGSPGARTATATARDTFGNESSVSGNVSIAPAPPPGDGIAPVVSGASLSNKSFRVGKAATAVAARKRRAKVGTSFRFALSEAAAVTIALERSTTGRKVGRRCVKATRANRKRKRCTRFVAAGKALRRSGKPGANSVAFSGRIGRKALKPGKYRAAIVATDASGNKSAPRRLAFTVVR